MNSKILVRHENGVSQERSGCGWRHRLNSREDEALCPAAWASMAPSCMITTDQPNCTMCYVLDGEGEILLDGEERPIQMQAS